MVIKVPVIPKPDTKVIEVKPKTDPMTKEERYQYVCEKTYAFAEALKKKHPDAFHLNCDMVDGKYTYVGLTRSR